MVRTLSIAFLMAALLAVAQSAAPTAVVLPSSPLSAVVAAAQDVQKIPAPDRRYYRYLWLPVEPAGRHDFLVALKFHVNLLSDQGEIANPVLVAPDTVRLDVRDYGWDKRLEVWEKFAELDIFFHVKAKLHEDKSILVNWPGGKWTDGATYEAGRYTMPFKAGATIDIAAPWITSAKMDIAGEPIHAIEYLRKELLTEAPVLNAQWFFVQTARQISIRNEIEGVGYYEWLGLKTRDDFFKLTGTDPKIAAKVFREWREIVRVSGISQQNRQVVVFGSTSGRVWGTLDTFKQKDRGIGPRNLRQGEFAHNAEEWYGFLGNGLFVTFLSDNEGKGVESAPDKIGPDDSSLNTSRDFRVHANLSCIRCHGQDKDFLKPIDGWARKAFREGGVLRLQEYDKKVYLELKSTYLRDLDRLLARDREDYMVAVTRATSWCDKPGLSAPKIATLYAKTWDDYVQKPLTIADAARELGITADVWIDRLKKYHNAAGKVDLVLSDHLDDPPRAIPRLDWEATYAYAMVIALGLYPPEQIEKVKVFP